MQRTLNYTKRGKIERKEALFSFSDPAAAIPEFNVEFALEGLASYPADASLYVEAYNRETRQRFSFGKVSAISIPADRKLDEIDLSGPTLFRVTVVDESGKHGLLLASGEGFRADSGDNPEEDRSSLMSVKTGPLGQKTWRVEIETGGMPELYLNNGIPNALEKMRSDATFQALILPAALKQVLTYYLWNSDEEGAGRDRWMAFAELFAEKPPENDDPIELISWVDSVVDGFSTKFSMCDNLVNGMRGAEE